MKVKIRNTKDNSLILIVKIDDEISDADSLIIKRYLYDFHPKTLKLIINVYREYEKEIYKNICKIVDRYNRNVWLIPLEWTISEDFIGKRYTFFAANTNYHKRFSFCPGFNVEVGDTFESIYQKHICKMIVQYSFIEKIKKFLKSKVLKFINKLREKC